MSSPSLIPCVHITWCCLWWKLIPVCQHTQFSAWQFQLLSNNSSTFASSIYACMFGGTWQYSSFFIDIEMTILVFLCLMSFLQILCFLSLFQIVCKLFQKQHQARGNNSSKLVRKLTFETILLFQGNSLMAQCTIHSRVVELFMLIQNQFHTKKGLSNRSGKRQ